MPSRLLAVALGMLALVVVIMPGAAEATIVCDRFGCSTGQLAQNRKLNGMLASRRPAGCPRAWCGCWLAHHLGLTDRKLWLARNWTRVGRPAAGPAPGVIAVFARGRRGGHVGIVKAVVGKGKIVLLSGNDGGRVRERERSTSGVIAYRVL